MRILIITPYLPHARVGHGGGTAVRQLVAELARQHEVLLLSLVRPGEQDLVATAAPANVRLETVPFADRGARGAARLQLVWQRLRAAGRAAWRGEPFYTAKYESAALDGRAVELASEFRPDAIQVEYLQMAGVLRALQRARGSALSPRLILESHEFGGLPRRRLARRLAWPARTLLNFEAAAWDRLARRASFHADATVCVTEQDRLLFEAAGARGLITIPLGVDTRNLRPERTVTHPRQILFVGSFQHLPNRTAAELLCERIWPAACQELPDWQLVLAGPGSAEFVDHLASPPPRLRGLGFVEDLGKLFRESGLFAAPLFEGGGIKIKVLEAMARGIPLITTPIGAEGIVEREQDLVAWAEDHDAFTRLLVATALAPDAATARAERARDYIEQNFSWEAVAARLERLYRGEDPLP